MQPVRLFWEEGVLCAQPLTDFEATRAEVRQPAPQILYCPKGQGFAAGETVVVELPAGWN